MTPLLTFGIPTWNRAEHLRVCATAMAEQIVASGTDTRILISDNASTDHTPQVIEQLQAKYDCIDSIRTTEHGDFAFNLKNLFAHAGGEYCWLFGDDDLILPGALQVVLPVVAEKRYDFIHCTDQARMSGDHRLVIGSLFELCSRLGWLEITGFLSSCLVRTKHLNAVARSKSWPHYVENAYPHACFFLERCGKHEAAIIDAPMVGLQEPIQTDDTLQRWKVENIGQRYFLVVDALPRLVQLGAMPAKVDATFFRYHKYFLWNKFVTSLAYEVFNISTQFPDETWRRAAAFADYLSDEKLAMQIRGSIGAMRANADTLLAARRLVDISSASLNLQFDQQNASVMSYAITTP